MMLSRILMKMQRFVHCIACYHEGEGKFFKDQEHLLGESTSYHFMWDQLSTTCGNVTEVEK